MFLSISSQYHVQSSTTAGIPVIVKFKTEFFFSPLCVIILEVFANITKLENNRIVKGSRLLNHTAH